jgi:hypothetical protein
LARPEVPVRRPEEVARAKNGSDPQDGAEVAAPLETELAAAREWAKVPADSFANLDHYLHGAETRSPGAVL